MLSRLELMMLMEFIILHSSAFLAFAMSAPQSRLLRIGAVVGLGLVYTLFVGAFSLSFHTLWPIASFWILLTNRMLAVLMGKVPEGRDYDYIVLGWAVGVACYIGYTMLTAMANIPRLGISVAVQRAQPPSVGGLWSDQPWRVIAFGTFYYATVAVTELFGIGAPPAPEPELSAVALR
ncbi:MAG TPA: hypothetical protein VKB84_18200 [Candidatus Binataceae bacterium]|nr:hypothetical protein [Candidatus Binataceae bacterium]